MLREQNIQVGCDPEFFFEDTKTGRIIGAERILNPEKGLSAVDRTGHIVIKQNAVIVDGVQAEINCNAHTRTSQTVVELSAIFRALKEHLRGSDVKACFRTLIEVDQEELQSLSDKARIFGCAPSLNAYDETAGIEVDAQTYPFRAAGGHIHLGLHRPIYGPLDYEKDQRKRLIPLLDIFVGNTMVLIDRDPGVAERRKNYGRAGEYRLPKYGVEYRTVGNFWLRHNYLFGFVSGMCKLANTVLYETVSGGPDLEKELVDQIDIMSVIDAINLNDWDSAYKNFQVVVGFLKKHGGIGLGLSANSYEKFDYFAKSVRDHGIEKWFPQEPVEHWSTLPYTADEYGWENFLSKINTTQLPA